MSAGAFIINPRLMHETIEGETIMINGDTGNYYSLDPVGSSVWLAITAGAGAEEVVRLMAARYDGSAEEIGAAVTSFLERLEKEGLIVPNGGERAERTERLAVDSAGSAPQPFSPPTLAKHTDMQDLILLDPVHEVDPQRGWPHVAEPSA